MSGFESNKKDLLEKLASGTVSEKKRALTTLAQHPDPRLVPTFIPFLSDEIPELRATAAWSLGRIGEGTAVIPLIEALQDPDPYVRQNATHALGTIGDPRAVPALMKTLADSDYGVKKDAVNALGTIGHPQARPALEKILHGADAGLSKNAAYALARIGDDAALPALIEALELSYSKDMGYMLRESVLAALSNFTGPALATILLGTMKKTRTTNERGQIRHVLEDLHSDALPELHAAIEDEDWLVRRTAILVLGARGDRQALPLMKEAVEDSDWMVRWAAAEALGHFSGRSSEDLLRILLKDGNMKVRETATSSLESLRNDDRAQPNGPAF